MRDAQGNRCIQSTWIRWAPKPDRMTYVLTYRPVIGVLTLVFALLIACDSDHDIVLAHDLVAPRGLARAADGGILVAEGGAGRVLALGDDGEVVEVATGLPASLDAGPGGNTAAGPSGVTPWPNEGDALAVVVGEYRGGRFSRVYAVAADGSVWCVRKVGTVRLSLGNSSGLISGGSPPLGNSGPTQGTPMASMRSKTVA